MYCISLESKDPYFNLAIEEVLLKNSSEEFVILGINNSSVILGKHQSAHREINTQFIFQNNIPVVRRISGGGTVYHDEGNLNFTFIRQSQEGRQVDFKKYTKPVIDFLLSVGIDAKFEGKNDIKTGGLKISGNAEHVHRNRVLHHGTLLFSSSLDKLRNSLRKDQSGYTSRAVESNPSSVINIREKLSLFSNIYDFRDELMRFFLENLPDTQKYSLSANEIREAESLAHSKYMTWEWNYAYGPEYTLNKSFQLNGELINCSMMIKDGIICDCRISGNLQMANMSEKLVGCRHMVEDMRAVFTNENINLGDEEIFNFF